MSGKSTLRRIHLHYMLQPEYSKLSSSTPHMKYVTSCINDIVTTQQDD